MKIYRALTNAKVRNFIRRLDSFCATKLPTFYAKVFLPTKAAAKSALLKYSVSRPEKSAKSLSHWKISVQKNFSPLISVVVPNFNHAPFLQQRLETIYNQTYKNFEVILLDDASTDNSREILRDFYERHKNNTRLILNEKNFCRHHIQKGVLLHERSVR